MTGRSMLILVLTRPSLLLLEPWPPLEKALVVEKGMNRESDEREILDHVRVSTQETCEIPGAFAEPELTRDRDGCVEPAPTDVP